MPIGLRTGLETAHDRNPHISHHLHAACLFSPWLSGCVSLILHLSVLAIRQVRCLLFSYRFFLFLHTPFLSTFTPCPVNRDMSGLLRRACFVKLFLPAPCTYSSHTFSYAFGSASAYTIERSYLADREYLFYPWRWSKAAMLGSVLASHIRDVAVPVCLRFIGAI